MNKTKKSDEFEATEDEFVLMADVKEAFESVKSMADALYPESAAVGVVLHNVEETFAHLRTVRFEFAKRGNWGIESRPTGSAVVCSHCGSVCRVSPVPAYCPSCGSLNR